MNAALKQFFAIIRRFPIAALLLALFTGLGTGNYLLWKWQRGISQRYEEVRRNGIAMERALTGRTRIAAELAAVKEALTQIDGNLVVEGDLAENLGYFYGVETASHVRLSQLNQLSSQPVAEGSPYRAVPFSLRVTGTYSQLINFLRELETGPRLLRIKTFGLSRADPVNTSLSLELTAELLGSQ